MAKLSNRTFGVEFELTFDERSFHQLMDDHGGSLSEDAVENFSAEENNETAKEVLEEILYDSGFPRWAVHLDQSVKGGDYQLEVVTPILRGSQGLKQLLQFCNFIKPYAEVNQTTGLHVHVGAQDFKQGDAAEKLTSAMIRYKNVEKLFDDIVETHRKGNNAFYAKSSQDAESVISRYKTIIRQEKNTIDGIIKVLQDDRYQKFNIESLLKHGTLEFRQLQGTLNGEYIKNWVILCMAFVDSVKDTEETFFNFLKDIKTTTASSQYELSENDINNEIFAKAFYPVVRTLSETGKNELSYEQLMDVAKTSQALPDVTIEGEQFLARKIPLNQLQKLCYPKADIPAIIERTINGYDYTVRNLHKGGGQYDLSSDGISVYIPKSKLNAFFKRMAPNAQIDADKINQAEKEKLQQVNQSAPGVTGLPQRNLNKAYKQSQAANLKEEIASLSDLINNY